MNDYQIGLMYCIHNDIEKAYFYLKRAANTGNEIAIHTLKELQDKNLLPTGIKDSKKVCSVSNPIIKIDLLHDNMKHNFIYRNRDKQDDP